MLVDYIKENNYARFFILTIIGTDKDTLVLNRHEILTKSTEHKI